MLTVVYEFYDNKIIPQKKELFCLDYKSSKNKKIMFRLEQASKNSCSFGLPVI